MQYRAISIVELSGQLHKNMYCFGAGKAFDSFMQEFADFKLESHIKAIADNHADTLDVRIKNINGVAIPIISTEQMLADITDQDCILITTAAYEAVIGELEQINRLCFTTFYIYYILRIEQYDYDRRHTKMPVEAATYKEIQIPKVIHYCWFGRQKIPEQYRKWMESWKRYCPDYEIVEWNEDNYDVHKNRYVDQAYSVGKWAFVSDYARIDIIREYGGVYLDTDVELVKGLDELLKNDAFCGFESCNYVAFGLGFGAKRSHELLQEIQEYYDNIRFILADGSLNQINCPVIQTEVLRKHGLVCNGDFQVVNGMTIYPPIVLCGMSPYSFQIEENLKDTYAIHHFAASWMEDKAKMKWNTRIADIRKWMGRDSEER